MSRRGTSGVPIFETHTMDFSARVHFAQRAADGQWFKRVQGRDPRYGYKWGRWTPCADPGDRINRHHPNEYAGRARLPKVAS